MASAVPEADRLNKASVSEWI